MAGADVALHCGGRCRAYSSLSLMVLLGFTSLPDPSSPYMHRTSSTQGVQQGMHRIPGYSKRAGSKREKARRARFFS